MVEIVPLNQEGDLHEAAQIIKSVIYSDDEVQTPDKVLESVTKAGIVIGAIENGRIVAAVIGSVVDSEHPHLFVQNIATLPDYQGHRIGEQLMMALENRAKQVGAKFAALFSLKDSEAFYGRLGYQNPLGTGSMVKQFGESRKLTKADFLELMLHGAVKNEN